MPATAYRLMSLAAMATTASLVALSACTVGTNEPDSEELVGAPEEQVGQAQDAITGTVAVGSTLTSTADVNLRTGPSTSYKILHVVPHGAHVTVVASHPQNGFYKVKHNGVIGWSYGQYYKAGSSGSSGGGSTGGSSSARDGAIARAKSAMGFSYWWGHARFLPGGPTASTRGSCSGSCPSCTHHGSYGGDCSGLVGKVWEVPSSNTPLSYDYHPYSTASFINSTSMWKVISRSNLIRGDAMVYNEAGHGHTFIWESGDGWGSMVVYECKGCSYGCVHDTRTASSAYRAIRRVGY